MGVATGGRAIIGLELVTTGKPIEFSDADRQAIADMRARYPDGLSLIHI